MKRIGAFLLAFFVLILSVKSSIGMHFCQDVLVETSINQTLSSCCKKNTKHNQPILSKQCCEVAHFTLEFKDTVIASVDVTLSALIVEVPVIQFELLAFENLPKQPLSFYEPPPESSHTSLHILFEQYLI